MPVDKMVGDEVSSGTVNQFGAFTMKATKVGEDSSIQRMIRLVQSADAGKAKIVGLADRWATWIVVIALTAALLTWLISGEIIRAVTILVVFCPCALVLATPTAIMAAIGNATKHGFLVSQGDALERLAKVSKITFDKTGTLTYGTPKVTAVHSILDEFSDEKLYHIIASAEQLSEHPLGKAVVASYRSTGEKCSSVEEFHMIPGEGVCAQVSQKAVLAGNEKMMQSHHVMIPDLVRSEANQFLKEGCTVIFVAVTDQMAGYVVLTDTVREESEHMLKKLKQLGVKPVLLTGDNPGAAGNLGKKLTFIELFN
jgi:P-type E1-E2 ATPase